MTHESSQLGAAMQQSNLYWFHFSFFCYGGRIIIIFFHVILFGELPPVPDPQTYKVIFYAHFSPSNSGPCQIFVDARPAVGLHKNPPNYLYLPADPHLQIVLFLGPPGIWVTKVCFENIFSNEWVNVTWCYVYQLFIYMAGCVILWFDESNTIHTYTSSVLVSASIHHHGQHWGWRRYNIRSTYSIQ